MPGRVLIIDDLATNRIILKVKLAAAYYEVAQAASVDEVCDKLGEICPDLILLGYRGTGHGEAGAVNNARTLREMLGKLHGVKRKGFDTPVVVLLDSNATQDRIAALNAGAAEAMSRPLDEKLLLARLRSLMRQRLANLDLHHHSMTTQPQGFAEQQHGFDLPGKIGVITQDKVQARKLQSRLAAHARHDLRMMSPEEIMCPGSRAAAQHAQAAGPPDVFVMQLDTDQAEHGPRLLSELRADPDTRNCPVIAHLPDEERALAAQLYDLGAGDVVFSDTDAHEIALRLERQLSEKRLLDRLRDQLQDGLQAAVTDPLTGLYNRRYALSYLDKLLDQHARAPDAFAVMVADLDHFKQVNDRLGHTAGDAVLRHVAQLLKSCLRKDDVVARIGGEEFLIILPGTSPGDAGRLATELCNSVGSTPTALPGHADPVRVTISIGLALATTLNATGADIIDRADQALYRSKAEGRNTVRLATQDAA